MPAANRFPVPNAVHPTNCRTHRPPHSQAVNDRAHRISDRDTDRGAKRAADRLSNSHADGLADEHAELSTNCVPVGHTIDCAHRGGDRH